MPQYDVKHLKTGETKQLNLTISAYEQWKEDNPDWERYYTPENAPKFGEVGEWKDKLVARNPGWNDVLAKAQKAPGSRVKKI